MEYIIGIIFCTLAAFFAYMTSHVLEEEKRGRYIPLPWEKK
tara:strand:+ start:57 stop:179 length:123 start_codon:yes stop_codon:yes gene_type:complete